jgi:hypothetical protein
VKQLLILGNGFDLQAKLASKYEDFFKNRLTLEKRTVLDHAYSMCDDYALNSRNVETSKTNTSSLDHESLYFFLDNSLEPIADFFSNMDFEPLRLSDLTFWDLYFYYLKDMDQTEWHVIEQQIYNFLTGSNKINEYSMDIFFKRSSKTNSKIIASISSFFSSNILSDSYNNETKCIQFLQAELKRLEIAFSDYLSESIKENAYYHENSRKLMASLSTGSKYLLELKNNTITPELLKNMLSELTIINFNYTNPVVFSNNPDSPDKDGNKEFLLSKIDQEIWNGLFDRTLYVHGSLGERNAIFGIDSTNVNTDSQIYRFTKTYKQLVGFYGSNAVPSKLPDKNQLAILAFYGHSLSPLDYSYFQSLFDYYSIYDSNIHLIFYYSVYGENPDFETLRQSQVEHVLNLLSSYAETISNEGHRKNLIHKLSLEQRLSVVQLLPTEPHWFLRDTDGSLDPMFKKNIEKR